MLQLKSKIPIFKVKMEIVTHLVNDVRIAEALSEKLIITGVEDGLELLGNLYYQDFDRIIIHQKNIAPEFFDLKTGIAGEILQKFSNYRVRLAIVGDFGNYQSKSLPDFIFETNKGRQIHFTESSLKAIDFLNFG